MTKIGGSAKEGRGQPVSGRIPLADHKKKSEASVGYSKGKERQVG